MESASYEIEYALVEMHLCLPSSNIFVLSARLLCLFTLQPIIIMKIEKIAIIYIVMLGIVTFLNVQFPSQMALVVDFFFPTTFYLTSQDFIRYRMALFIAASGTFLVLLPIIFFLGILGMTSEQIKRVHWRHIVILVLALPITFIGYPFLSLCPTCWTANDIFYFLLTVFFFVGLQMSFHAIFLKIIR